MYLEDLVFQLFVIIIPVVLGAIALFSWWASKKRKEQLARIEQKLEQIKKE